MQRLTPRLFVRFQLIETRRVLDLWFITRMSLPHICGLQLMLAPLAVFS